MTAVSTRIRQHQGVAGTTPAEREHTAQMEKSYVTALLITGCDRLAEDSVAGAVEQMACRYGSSDDLVRTTVRISLMVPSNPASPKQAAGISELSRLPSALRRVLNLPRYQRICFVIHMLLGYSRNLCASLVHLEGNQVVAHARAAMHRLGIVGTGVAHNLKRTPDAPSGAVNPPAVRPARQRERKRQVGERPV